MIIIHFIKFAFVCSLYKFKLSKFGFNLSPRVFVNSFNRNSCQTLKNRFKNYYMFWSILLFLFLSSLFFLPRNQLLLFYKMAKNTDFVISMLNEIESINSSRPQLQQIVVKTLFADAYHGSSVLERVSLQLYLIILIFVWHHYAIIEFSPN